MALQKLIECWRPIDEAPKDGSLIFVKIDGINPVTGLPYTFTKVEWCDKLKMFLPEDIAHTFYCDDEDFELPSGTKNWNKRLTHYMPLDTPEKLAKIVGVLAGALGTASRDLRTAADLVRCHRYGDATSHSFGRSEAAKKALQQAEKIAGGDNV